MFILLFFIALVITNGPMNVTVCSGTNAEISCGFTGVPYPFNTRPNWSWRIIKRNNDGYVISNETVTAMDINANRTDGLVFSITTRRDGITSANDSYLSVGPVDDTYNNTSYQCIFSNSTTIIESDTAGTITVIGKHVASYIIIHKSYLIYYGAELKSMSYLLLPRVKNRECPTSMVMTQQPVITLGVESFDLRDERKRVLLF